MSTSRTAVVALLIAAALAGTALAGAALARAAPLPAAGRSASFSDGSGLHILSQRWLDPRLAELSFRTAALPQPVNVRILVPARYASQPWRHYPVLYLLDGTSGHASDWTTVGGAEQTTQNLPLIVVMPDITLNGDGGGWCSDWPGGAERWETFHIDQLIPWVDHHLRTIRTRAGRAIAGLSQGGFCSMSYAARHPDLFAMALAYSGAPDIYYDLDARAGAKLIINATEFGLTRVPPETFFGNQETDGINWAAHDPATLAPNLRNTKLAMYFGNGLPGPYDNPWSPYAASIEGAVNRDNIDFHNRLDQLGIPSTYDPYGNGTHIFPYWARDLRWSIGLIMQAFAHPPAAPRAVSYASAEPTFKVYGWSVATHRTVREFATLSDATCAGFTLSGSGSATVTTPACSTRGRRLRVTIRTTNQPPRRLILTVSRGRRLTLSVPLGPSNRYQQDTPQAAAFGTAVYRTRVSISSVPTPPRRHRRSAAASRPAARG